MKKFNIIDFENSNSISGSGFAIFVGLGSQLHNALINFFLNYNYKKEYIGYTLPYLVKSNSLYGTGQIPDKENQLYEIKDYNLYLIPTGEVPLINLYNNNILNESNLPIKNTTYTTCFRKEAGSYGRKVKGLNRLHQFDKIEITQICASNNSNRCLREMVLHIKNLLKLLKIPFRIIKLCPKNLSNTSAITYDFEIYSIVQKM